MNQKSVSRILRFFICILGLLLPIALKCNGQTFYNTFGNASGNEGGTAIVVGNDGSIYVGGTSNDSCLIFKLDSSGNNVIWSRKFLLAPSGRNQIKQLVITPDGYLIGSAHIGCPTIAFCGSGYFKFDLNGNMIWCKTLSNPNNYSIERVLVESNNRYILVSMDYQITGNYSDWKLFKINATTGNIVSQSGRIDEEHDGLAGYYDDIYSATQIQNGSFYFCGRIYANQPGADNMRPNVVKMDTNFNVIWSNFYFKPSTGTAKLYPFDIKTYEDTVVLVYEGDKNGVGPSISCGIIKLDKNGTVIFQKDLDIVGSSRDHPSTINVLPDGYLIYGCTNLGIAGPQNLFAIKTDRNAIVQWAKLIGSATENETIYYEVFSTGELHGNYFYFTAEKASQGKIIVGKMDLNGTVNCADVSNLTVNTNTIPNFRQANTVRSETTNVITVNPVISIPTSIYSACSNFNIGRDTSFCSAFVFTIQAPVLANTQYLWSTGDTTTSITVQDSGKYFVTLSTNCCAATDTIILSISGLQKHIQTLSICSGDSILIGTHYYANSGNYLDTLINQFGCDSIVNTILSIYANQYNLSSTLCSGDSLLFNGTYLHTVGTYSDTLISFRGCDSIVTLTVSPQLLTTYAHITIGNDTAFCTSFSYTISAPLLNNAHYLWNTGDTSNFITVQDSGLYSISIASGCTIFTDSILIFRNFPQQKTQLLILCSGDSLKVGNHFYSVSGVYLDTLQSSEGCDSIVKTTLAIYPTHFAISKSLCTGDSVFFKGIFIKSSGTYYDTLSSFLGCDSLVSFTVLFQSIPSIVVSGDSILCAGESINLTASGAQNYNWWPSTGLNLTNQSSVIASPNITTKYSVVGTNGLCFDSTTINIKVVEIPKSQFSYNMEACNLKVNFSTTNISVTKCKWNFGDGYLSEICAPFHSYPAIGSYTVSLQLTNDQNCTADTSFKIYVDESLSSGQLKIPNFFTPNGDGLSDVFYFGNYPDCYYISFEIYTALGQLIYQSSDVAKGWNGANSNGATSVFGTYFYVLKGKSRNYSGFIELMR